MTRIDRRSGVSSSLRMLRYSAAVVLGALCLGSASCDRIQKKQKEREALREMKSSSKEVIDSMEMTEDGMIVDTEKARQAQQNLIKSGEKMGGKLGEAIKISAEIQGKVAEAGGECAKAGDEAGHYFDMEALSKARDYTVGIEKFRKLIAVNEEMLVTLEAFSPELMKRLDAIGFDGKGRRDFDGGFKKKWEKTYESLKVIRESDIALGKVGISLMEGLQKGDAYWSWDAEAKATNFENDAQIEWFQAQMKQVEELGEAQSKAQQNLMRHLKAP